MATSFHPTPSPKVTIIVPYSCFPITPPDAKYKKYRLRPELLTAQYFQGRLQQPGPIWYGAPQAIILQETLVEYFDVYDYWLLTNVLVLTEKVGDIKQAVTSPEQAKAGYNNLLSCCSLAGFIRLLTHDRVEQIIAESGVHTGFFKLIAHAYARFATVDEIRILAFSNYNMYFKGQVMQSMAGMRTHQHMDGNAARDFVVSTCYYHSYGFYEACTQPKA